MVEDYVVIANRENANKIKRIVKEKVIIQKEHGIHHAVREVPYTENVLVINSNDLIEFNRLKELKKLDGGAIFYKKTNNYIPGGYILKEDNKFRIIEKPGEEILTKTNMFNILVHYHPKFSDIIEKIEEMGNNEERDYEIAVSENSKNYKLIETKHVTIKYPFHVLDAVQFLLSKKKNEIRGNVSELSNVKHSYIAKTAEVGDFSKVINSYIGPNVVIGDHTLIRDSIIEDNCIIGRSEITRSHINENSNIHGSYIGDSVVGKNVNFGFGSVTANLRHDGKEIYFYTKGNKKIPTGRTKLGAFVKDGVHLGIMTKIYPGRIVDHDTLPGESVRFLKNERR